MNFHQFLIPRMEGAAIETNFGHYLRLVQKGIGGFIVFGGELEPLREGIRRLQEAAELPLLIASDLEQGLGQQVKGGTLFPPAMSMSEAARKELAVVRSAFETMAEEAAYAGINAVLAPVLDINTNPENPIICTRAFCESPRRVADMGVEMIQALQSHGVMACGKHFPGHGDTDFDSHITLPEITKTLAELETSELLPFREAVRSGVEMIMPGHLSVPAIDPSGEPMTISSKAIYFLRETIGFHGIIITDAMNMGGIGGHQPAPSVLALKAGVDLLLHPDDPERIAAEIQGSGITLSDERLRAFRKRLIPFPSSERPSFDSTLSDHITGLSLRIDGPARPLRSPFVVTISDDPGKRGEVFISSLGATGSRHITAGASEEHLDVPAGSEVVVAVFSETRAWKGGTALWIRDRIRELSHISSLFVAFGNPYTLREVRLDDIREGATKAYAYWTGAAAQRAMAQKIRDMSLKA